MITFAGTRLLVVAVLVWIPWRLLVWRRNGGDPVREAVVAALFAWSLVIVKFTMFPLVIVLYDWRGRGSFVPFASIVGLLRDSPAAVAFENIAGNLLLLAPLGILLPLLFVPLRRFPAFLWRVAAISASIEVVQLITRARSVDVDDVILNVTGAAVGLGAFWLGTRAARRVPFLAALLDRVGAQPSREPLLLAAVPAVVTAAITVPLMLSTVVSATLGSGGILADATAAFPGSEVVGRGDIGADTFVIVGDGDQIALVGYKRVLPGRYTWVLRGEPVPAPGPRYDWGITAFNVAKGERPTVYVWGRNPVGAASLVVEGEETVEMLRLPDEPYFAVGFRYDPDPDSLVLETFRFRFLDPAGTDVTDEFAPPGV